MAWRRLIFFSVRFFSVLIFSVRIFSVRILRERIILKPSLLAIGLFAFLLACTNTPFPRSKSINPAKPLAVALLVPYGSASTSDTIIARNLENAARLAIDDLQGVEIDLRIYPTKASSEVASQAARQAVDEGAKIILGPVYAKNANAAALAVRGDNVNLLAFSNNPNIAGGNLFLLGQLFSDTAAQLTQFAATQNKRKVFVLNAQTPAGILGRQAIEGALRRSPATLSGSLSYAFTREAIVESIDRAANEIKFSGANTVFLTAGISSDLPFIAQLLPEKGIRAPDYQYIGLTRWDSAPQLFKLQALNGGWFAMPEPEIYQKFVTHYSERFGTRPHPLAGLSYDGIAAIGALIKSRKANALKRSSLTQRAGFIGVNGAFRLLSDGTNQRQLAIATIENGKTSILAHAINGFGPAH